MTKAKQIDTETAKKSETCESLTSAAIPDGVTEVENGAFFNCQSLTSVTVPNSVTGIGNYAFYECTKLTSITIPNSVTSIGDFAFENCTSLTSITFEGTVEQWNAITKGYAWNRNTPATEVKCAKKVMEQPSIQKLRQKYGLTQNALADRFGIPLRTVQQWCSGSRKPPDYVVRMMIALLENDKNTPSTH